MAAPSLTLALGGGGARGLAHLGVIEVLLDAGFRVDRIVGISIGSLAGALFALEPDIRRVQQRTLGYLLSDQFQRQQHVLFGAKSKSDAAETGGVFSWYDRVKDYMRANRHFHRVISRPSLLPGVVLQDVVDHLLPDADVADAKIPLSIVTVDLLSGHKVVLEKGRVRDAVRASSSLPGIFPPVEMDGMLLCDVGVFCSLPTTLAISYPGECVVAVDVSSGLQRLSRCETAFDILIRMDEIGESMFRKYVKEAADVIIHPDVSGMEWFDFAAPEQVIDSGRKAARSAITELRAALQS